MRLMRTQYILDGFLWINIHSSSTYFIHSSFCLAYRQYIFDPFVKSVYDNLFFMYYNFQFLSLYDFRWKRMIHWPRSTAYKVTRNQFPLLPGAQMIECCSLVVLVNLWNCGMSILVNAILNLEVQWTTSSVHVHGFLIQRK